MGRLRPEFIERVTGFAHRVVDVAEVLEADKRSGRIVEQMVGSGTSAAANICESDEAMSRADFCKGLGIANKEIVETLFWLRFVGQRGWVKPDRVSGLIEEAQELKKIVGTILNKSRVRKTTV